MYLIPMFLFSQSVFCQSYLLNDNIDSLYLNYISGTWEIYDYILADISTWGDEDAESQIGKDIMISKTFIKTFDGNGKTTNYNFSQQKTVEYFFNGFRTNLKKGYVDQDSFLLLEIKYDMEESHGLRFHIIILNDYTVIIPWNGVFFRLRKL